MLPWLVRILVPVRRCYDSLAVVGVPQEVLEQRAIAAESAARQAEAKLDQERAAASDALVTSARVLTPAGPITIAASVHHPHVNVVQSFRPIIWLLGPAVAHCVDDCDPSLQAELKTAIASLETTRAALEKRLMDVKVGSGAAQLARVGVTSVGVTNVSVTARVLVLPGLVQ